MVTFMSVSESGKVIANRLLLDKSTAEPKCVCGCVDFFQLGEPQIVQA